MAALCGAGRGPTARLLGACALLRHSHKAPMGKPPAVGGSWVANELDSLARWGEVGVYTHRAARGFHDVANWPRQQRENASTLSI